MERHVTFAGLVDNAAVARYCAAADLFVLPSLLEALPTVAVEALACGTPVALDRQPGRRRAERPVRAGRRDRAARAADGARRRRSSTFLGAQAPDAAWNARHDRARVPCRRPWPRNSGRSTRCAMPGTRRDSRRPAAALLGALASAAWLALFYALAEVRGSISISIRRAS